MKEDGARAIAGLVAIVRDGNFAGVVSETEDGAEAALKALRKGAAWSSGETLPDEDAAGGVPESPAVGADGDRQEDGARTSDETPHDPAAIYPPLYRACLDRAVLRHGAVDGGDRVHVWTHSQGVYLLRADLALVLKLPAENITVEHMEGAGCYGHNAADDVALDAVLLAKAAGGRPVRVQWSREDEMTHAPFGAAMAVEIEADLDAQKRDRRLAPQHLEQRPCRAAGTRGVAGACLREPRSQIRFRARSPPIRRRPMAAAPIATRSRSMIFRRGRSNAIAC